MHKPNFAIIMICILYILLGIRFCEGLDFSFDESLDRNIPDLQQNTAFLHSLHFLFNWQFIVVCALSKHTKHNTWLFAMAYFHPLSSDTAKKLQQSSRLWDPLAGYNQASTTFRRRRHLHHRQFRCGPFWCQTISLPNNFGAGTTRFSINFLHCIYIYIIL